ncbi:Plasma membrane iron permease [Wickerhamomyces ciferrii]|uniref:Plasma membrane iron permease n=1 Tax=Wickerhamomyces ciferrii (strain ATCC 14091 / BCRC 22168 / CBS 111 / JCM 3599 / NBRC 0793 / NRRL Y-1031 F-60-10) TaxID=1206466 RepID=K0KEC5_WICCF|nr:Plasma membrane iron permease [Wickerhamomyces ciferrii]CCH43485.1 Plasma membrane iron permease [Wickerhamomyces ciferrii]
MGSSSKVFNVAVFFVVLRECLEAVVVISVLLSFLKQAIGDHDPKLYKKLRLQVWIGAFVGVFICLAIGGGFIGAYYGLQNDIFGGAEDLWEGIFCMIATVMISFMGIAMLRVNKMQAKWRVKIAKSLVEVPERKVDRFKIGYLTKKYSMFLLPAFTTLREGLEAVVFVAGAGITTQGAKASSYPLPVVVGLIAGSAAGVLLYYGTSYSSMQVFLVISTCIMYLIAAGLFSRGVWYFESNTFNKQTGGDASESGDGNGSYDISKAVYHVNCCNPELDNGWDIFNSLLGWQNTGYIGSVLAYNLYWLVLIIVVLLMLYEEKTGHLPFCKNLGLRHLNPMYWIKNKKKNELTDAEREELFRKAQDIRFNQEGGLETVHDGPVEEVQHSGVPAK